VEIRKQVRLYKRDRFEVWKRGVPGFTGWVIGG